jgi:hypothetical protein
MNNDVLRDYPAIKLHLAKTSQKVSRRAKAAGLLNCFIACACLLLETEKEIRPEDWDTYMDMQTGLDWRGVNTRFTEKETQEQVKWVRQRYPQIAAIFDLWMAVWIVMETKSLYTYYDCKSLDEWYRLTDSAAYLETLAIELGYTYTPRREK